MTKTAAYKALVDCAKLYRDNLVNRKLLFIFQEGSSINFLEAVFLPRHYLHLTGVECVDKKLRSVDFYEMCVDRNLPPSAFEFKKNGTSQMKLSVLNHLMFIHETAKMIGRYTSSKVHLVTEKIAGTYIACIGFTQEYEEWSKQKQNDLYVPNTTLREDIRKVVEKPAGTILAIFRKPKTDKIYSECTYLANRVDLENVLPDEIKAKIALKQDGFTKQM